MIKIEEIESELIEDMINKESTNLINDFAFPFPVIVIAQLLGIPVQDCPKF